MKEDGGLPPPGGANPRPQPVPWIADLEPATHGAFEPSAGIARGVSASQILDFSANGNVIGPPAGVARALKRVDLSRYPDRGAIELRRAIAERHGLPTEGVVVGNGSTELIWAAARAYLCPGASALVVSPTYGEYEVASRAAGAQVEQCIGIGVWELGAKDRALPPQGRRELLARRLTERQLELAWICHPNNPTGQPFAVEALPELFALAPRCLFVVDEGYLTLSEGLPSALSHVGTGHAVVLRSLTKDMGLAGVRIGYALCSPEVASVIQRALPPWSVSAPAQAAAQVALADAGHLERARQAVAASRGHLLAGLRAIGLHPYPSPTNFALVGVGPAAQVTMALLNRGFAVRDCTSFGLPDCIRIGVRAISDQERLLAALGEVCSSMGEARG